jgi:hypothetical protein
VLEFLISLLETGSTFVQSTRLKKLSEVNCPHDFLSEHHQLFEIYQQHMEEYIKNLASRDPGNPFDEYGTDVTVDQYLNLHFKEQFPLPERIINTLQTRCPYYRWLLDLEGHDYSKFRANWVWHAFTTYYQRHLRKSTTLRRKLHEIFTRTKRQDIGDLLIKLYVGPEP